MVSSESGSRYPYCSVACCENGLLVVVKLDIVVQIGVDVLIWCWRTAPSVTDSGFHGMRLVILMWGHVDSSSCVGNRDVNASFVPLNERGIVGPPST